MQSKDALSSTSAMTLVVMAEDLNQYGSLLGGRVLAWADRIASICAIRHARCNAVMVALEAMSIDCPVKQGDILTLSAQLSEVEQSRMRVEVSIQGEDPWSGAQRQVCLPVFFFAALDREGRPPAVPPFLNAEDQGGCTVVAADIMAVEA